MGKLEEMRVVELRSELKKRGLSSIGRKSDLLERLKPVLKEESKTHDDSESSASHAKTTKTQDQVAKKKPIEVREDIPKTQQPLVVQKPIEKRIESSKEIPKPSNVEVESKAAQPQKEIKSPEHQKEEPQPPKEIKRLEVKKAEALSESEVVSENAPRRKLVRQQQSPTDGQTTLTVMKQRIVPASKKTDSVVKPKTTAPDGAAAAQKERARMEEELRLRAKLSLTQRRLKKLGQDSPKSTKQPSESTSGTDMTSQALTSDEMQALLDMPSTSSTKPPAVPQDEQKDAAAQPQGMQEDADAQEVQADVKVQTDEESEKKLQKLSDRNKKIAASRIIRQKQTESVRIDGFILPLTKEEVQNKLEEFGNVTLFCMADHLKYCYATFESKKEASAAIQALNRVPWPKPKRPPLTVRFVPNAAVEEAHKKSEEKQARHAKLKRTREESGEHEEEEDKADDASPRVERVGSLDTEPDAQDEVSQPPRKRKVLVVKKKVHQEESGASTHEGSRVSNHRSREPEQFNLDVLFRKTRTEPCIYWLPLTEEEILEKQRGGGTTQPWHAHSSDGDRRGMRGVMTVIVVAVTWVSADLNGKRDHILYSVTFRTLATAGITLAMIAVAGAHMEIEMIGWIPPGLSVTKRRAKEVPLVKIQIPGGNRTVALVVVVNAERVCLQNLSRDPSLRNVPNPRLLVLLHQKKRLHRLVNVKLPEQAVDSEFFSQIVTAD
eukprot:g21752.t1